MADLLLTAVRGAVVVAFVAVAVVGLLRSRKAHRPARWAAAAFTSLAVVLLAGAAEDALGLTMPGWAGDVLIVLLLLFPYLLFRFAAAFRPAPRTLEAAAAIATATVIIAMPLADVGDGETTGWYLVAVLATWVFLSLVTIVRLWRAGAGQPTLARRRMRLMAVATAALAAALLLAAQPGGDDTVRDLAVQTAALVAAVAFGLGFAPPRMLRLAWRRPEDEALQAGIRQLMRAASRDDVTNALLPPTVAIMGASAAAIVDDGRRVVATHGDAPPLGAHLDADAGTSHRTEVPLAEPYGSLVVWTSPYTPFFGTGEVELLDGLAAIASLALERSELLGQLEQATQQAHSANAAKTDFLSRMSHELRTPLNAILGFGQLLQTEVTEPSHLEWIDRVLKAGHHLLALISDVLDLSQVEAGRLAISVEPVHAGELIGGALTLIQPLAGERSITITSDHDALNTYVRTDRQRCTQVLLNLLSNAIKYNYDGGSVHLTSNVDADDTLTITVRDTGPGIAAEHLDRLFEPFDRLGAENTTVEGTGLGLALSKNLIEAMGGTLTVDSIPGGGSSFHIRLPIAQPPAEDVDHPSQADADTRTEDRGHKRSVLLIEDNLSNLHLVEAILDRRGGFEVIAAMQGALGIDLGREHRPDLILLDLHLPDIPGEQVLARLRADPRTSHIPVVILSADATPGSIRRLRDAGATDYVTKPLDLDHFLQVVEDAMSLDPDTGAAGRSPDDPVA